jgi:flagellar export protein FliJ
MKSGTTLIRLRKWRVDEIRQQLTELDKRRAALLATIEHLDVELGLEAIQAEGSLEAGMTFPSYLTKVKAHREACERDIIEIDGHVRTVTTALQEAFQDLKRVEIVEENRAKRLHIEEKHRIQSELDAIAIQGHHRKRSAD